MTGSVAELDGEHFEMIHALCRPGAPEGAPGTAEPAAAEWDGIKVCARRERVHHRLWQQAVSAGWEGLAAHLAEVPHYQKSLDILRGEIASHLQDLSSMTRGTNIDITLIKGIGTEQAYGGSYMRHFHDLDMMVLDVDQAFELMLMAEQVGFSLSAKGVVLMTWPGASSPEVREGINIEMRHTGTDLKIEIHGGALPVGTLGQLPATTICSATRPLAHPLQVRAPEAGPSILVLLAELAERSRLMLRDTYDFTVLRRKLSPAEHADLPARARQHGLGQMLAWIEHAAAQLEQGPAAFVGASLPGTRHAQMAWENACTHHGQFAPAAWAVHQVDRKLSLMSVLEGEGKLLDAARSASQHALLYAASPAGHALRERWGGLLYLFEVPGEAGPYGRTTLAGTGRSAVQRGGTAVVTPVGRFRAFPSPVVSEDMLEISGSS